METETDFKRISKENYSKVDIKNKLKEEDIDISVKTVQPKFNQPPIKRTTDLISKVKRLVNRKNPENLWHIQKEKALALSTINQIIHHGLSKGTSKKSNAHYLTDRH